ncbi:DNA-binding protein [Wielerella bovis]|uniref:DNA-binding protein n=1 Tax=Wielerella bovis TaxID=2917790 RepID=UPI002018BF01|nr:DNA-binding protein [Wielerella bovis]ULJ61028.1 Mu transposase C-terminal domain-containing protein [Wielerella bovis]
MQFIDMNNLAKLKIKGLPETVRGLNKRAKSENWRSRPRAGRGGGVEYEIAALPAPIREAVEKKLAAEILAQQPDLPHMQTVSGSLNAPKAKKSRAKSKDLPTVHRPEDTQLALDLEDPNTAVKSLNFKQKDCANARMAIVVDVLSIGDTLNLSQNQAVAYFLEQMREGTLPERIEYLIPIANARSNNKRDLSKRTLMSWVISYKQADKSPNAKLLALAPRATKHETSPLSLWWMRDFMHIHRVPQKPKLAHSYEKFVKLYQQKQDFDMKLLPSLDVVRHAWKKLPEIIRERGRCTGSQYKQLLPYVKRDWTTNINPNQVWIIDGHSFKARVRHMEHGQPFVPEITFVIDGCTRKIVGFSIALAESSKAVADALRMGLRHGGLPVIIYSDNGKGETGRDITGELTGLCPRLDITHQTGIAGSPQGRGVIEGLWDSTLIKQAKTYPTYHGKDMDTSAGHLMYRKTESWAKAERDGKKLTDEQQKYKAMCPTWQQFYADLLATIDEYNHRPHRTLPKKDNGEHYNPTEYWAHRMAQVPIEEQPEILSEDELALLERSMDIRKPYRGWIRFNNQGYFLADLAQHEGDKVLIAYDWDKPQDIVVYHLDGRLIGTAILNGNTRDAFPNVKSMAQTQKENRAKTQITRLKNKAKRIEMDLNGGNIIENTPDFGKWLPDLVATNDVDFAKIPAVETVEVWEAEPEQPKKKYLPF